MIPGAPNPLMWGNGDPLDELGRIDRSLRLRRSAVGALNRTPTAAASTKWTLSFWVKRNQFGVLQKLFGIGTDNSGSNQFNIAFSASDQLALYWATGAVIANKITSRVFRSPAAWMHVVIAFDGTNATAEDRIIFYVNGVRETVFATSVNFSGTTYPWWNCSTLQHIIGAYGGTPDASDVYLAHVANVTDQALTPSAFGLVHPRTGQWRPRAKSVVKAVVDAGGTNSFFLAFDDTTSLTTLTADASAKGSNFTASNVSLTAGVTYDSMLDTPTTNYCTLNNLDKNPSVSTTDGNLSATSSAVNVGIRGTIGVNSGKWYWEVLVAAIGSTNVDIGLSDTAWDMGTYVGSAASTWGYFSTGQKYNNATAAAYGAAYTTGDIIGVAFDADAGTLSFYKNGVLQGQAYSGVSGTNPIFPAASGQTSSNLVFNFGQRPFTYTPPANFKTLCAKNLPRPGISRAFDYFKPLLYTGNGAGQSVSGLTFTPDLVWIKARSIARSHRIFNALRGVGKYVASDSMNAEVTDAQTLTAFNSNGFSLGSSVETNNSAESMVAWAFKAGGAPVANTAGSITAQVSANPATGISFATYTGNGAAATVGHGLGVAPKMIFVKALNGTSHWFVYHQSLGIITTTPQQGRLLLNDTGAAGTDTAAWNNTVPTASVFSVGASIYTNANASPMLALAFAEVSGFSRIGYYAGNGSSDGPFIACGFRPAFVLIKNIGAVFDWYIYDSARGPYNTPLPELYPNGAGAEGVGGGREIDFVSNGFKLRNTNQGHNASGNSYIYMAFAESPFRYSNAR